MSNSTYEYRDIAVIASTKGLDGDVVVKTYSNIPFLMTEGLTCYFAPPKIDVLRKSQIVQVTPQSDNRLAVSFEDVKSPDLAYELVGMHILISEKDFQEYKLDDDRISFIGWNLFDENGSLIGKISDEQNRVEQILLTVEDKSNTYLIPLADDLVIDIDEKNQKLTQIIPRGLLDL